MYAMVYYVRKFKLVFYWRASLLTFEKKSKMDRKAELEKKKQKLAALREEKERRRKEKEAKDIEDASGRVGAGQDKDTRRYQWTKYIY